MTTIVMLGGSGAMMKVVEAMEVKRPEIQIASFTYKVKEKRF